MHLANRIVLVTGASSGIGAATARAMSARGATVLLVARRQAALREVAASLPGLGAGRWLWIEETSNEEFLAQVAVPFHAAFFVTRAFIEPMLERGTGWVVNVNSPISSVAWPGAMGYGAARWAMRGFDECLAADLRGTGIGVTAVVAGRTDSDYFEANPGSLERVPSLDRFIRRLSPDDVASMIVRGVQGERRSVVGPVEVRLLTLTSQLSPRAVGWLLARTGATRHVRTGARARTP